MSALYRFVASAVAVAVLSFSTITTTVTPASARGEMVPFKGDASAGTIVVRTNERRLYLVLGEGRALSYPVGVGRAGRQWAGRSFIDGKHVKPAWSPTPSTSRPAWAPPRDTANARPNTAFVHEGGAPNNPMGAAALTLSGGEYA